MIGSRFNQRVVTYCRQSAVAQVYTHPLDGCLMRWQIHSNRIVTVSAFSTSVEQRPFVVDDEPIKATLGASTFDYY